MEPRRSSLSALSALALVSLLGCGPSADAEHPKPLPSETPPTSTGSLPYMTLPPTASAATPPEPTPEEKKKAEEAKKLEADKVQVHADEAKEAARWTPEMHAEAKKLADAKYTSFKLGLTAAMKSSHRKPGDADRDKYRHPIEMFDFFGARPEMTIVEIGPGEGWVTELVAPTLASRGHLMVTVPDPTGSDLIRTTLNGKHTAFWLDNAPELYGKVQRITVDNKKPLLGIDGKADMVLSLREVHGWINDGSLDGWLSEVNKSLKTGGVFGVEEHRAPNDADPKASAKKGYVPQAWLVAQVEAAGFKLDKASEINANPKDTKDYPEGVWSLPPTLREKDANRDKYLEIGESDRMTLRFVKLDPKKVPGKH